MIEVFDHITSYHRLRLAGDRWFGIESGAYLECPRDTIHFTMIFNTFVLMTLFNEINARKIHGQRNILEGLHTNHLFLGIWFGTLIAQVSLFGVHPHFQDNG